MKNNMKYLIAISLSLLGYNYLNAGMRIDQNEINNALNELEGLSFEVKSGIRENAVNIYLSEPERADIINACRTNICENGRYAANFARDKEQMKECILVCHFEGYDDAVSSLVEALK